VIHQLINRIGLVSENGRAGGGEEYSVMAEWLPGIAGTMMVRVPLQSTRS
jgi:hypothetical protein